MRYYDQRKTDNMDTDDCNILLLLPSSLRHGATRGVTVSTSGFLACGFESRSGFEFSGLSMWHFLKLVVRGFLRVLRFPPLLHRLMVSAHKVRLK